MLTFLTVSVNRLLLHKASRNGTDAPCPTPAQFLKETEGYQQVMTKVGAQGRLGFPRCVPVTGTCLPTASVKLGVSVDNSEGQQARYVLRFVLRRQLSTIFFLQPTSSSGSNNNHIGCGRKPLARPTGDLLSVSRHPPGNAFGSTCRRPPEGGGEVKL
jgi:hypothetical protein